MKGLDFDCVYAPVVDTTLVSVELAMAMQRGWATRQVDVKAALLNGDINREVFVSHPTNLPDMMQNNYYKLRKALYGLHRAPLQWF